MTWEELFAKWAKPPSQTEQDKCENALEQLKKAIDGSKALATHTVSVFAQGSYRNRTNVREDSDVDVCVLCTDVCFTDYSMSNDLTQASVGLVDSSYTYVQFKNEVEEALVSRFGRSIVSRGNKAFDIHESELRIDADVVACFEHRRYMKRADGSFYYNTGTELRPDNGGQIINWPEQNYENGVTKNKRTNHNFKAGVRILKCLRNLMDEKSISSAKPISSYLLECLIWNVPDSSFATSTYRDMVQNILAHLYNKTMDDEQCKEWGEINELKYLFRLRQPWTRDQTHTFLGDAWNFANYN
ncbi:MAG: nucleotidyltransferase [Patescibacteria group bacterium]|jgi:hypothetical protein